MQEKKVLVFGMTAETGGIEAFIMNYVRNMTGKGISFDFLVYNCCPAYSDEIEALGGRIIIIPGRGTNPVKCISAIKQVLRETKYHAVWCNLCYMSDILLLKYAKKANVPVRIIHAHSSENMSNKLNGFLHNRNRKMIDRFATDFWSCSECAGEFFYTDEIRSGAKYRIISNAIDTCKFAFSSEIREQKRRELNLSDKLVIGNVARMHFMKNQLFLLDIFKRIAEVRPNAVLLLVGDGELRMQIEEKISDLELGDKVVLLGRRSDVNELMCAMDVFVLPSLFEGLGIVLVEAQATGLRCFASNTVPEEARVTELLTYLDLKQSPEYWAENILSAENDKRSDRSNEVKLSGFDIKENAENLIRLF